MKKQQINAYQYQWHSIRNPRKTFFADNLYRLRPLGLRGDRLLWRKGLPGFGKHRSIFAWLCGYVSHRLEKSLIAVFFRSFLRIIGIHIDNSISSIPGMAFSQSLLHRRRYRCRLILSFLIDTAGWRCLCRAFFLTALLRNHIVIRIL